VEERGARRRGQRAVRSGSGCMRKWQTHCLSEPGDAPVDARQSAAAAQPHTGNHALTASGRGRGCAWRRYNKATSQGAGGKACAAHRRAGRRLRSRGRKRISWRESRRCRARRAVRVPARVRAANGAVLPSSLPAHFILRQPVCGRCDACGRCWPLQLGHLSSPCSAFGATGTLHVRWHASGRL
jgi:hypothetical protein